MKKAFLFFILGFVVAFYLIMNRSGQATHPMSETQEKRVSTVTNALAEFTSDVKTWLANLTARESTAVDSSVTTQANVDYDAALKIVSEMIEDIGSLLTTDQKAAIEKEVNQLYRKSLLKEYGNSTDNPKYYE